jgi:hypothetical protein
LIYERVRRCKVEPTFDGDTGSQVKRSRISNPDEIINTVKTGSLANDPGRKGCPVKQRSPIIVLNIIRIPITRPPTDERRGRFNAVLRSRQRRH